MPLKPHERPIQRLLFGPSPMGLNVDVPAAAIGPEQCDIAENVVFRNGVVSRALGYTQFAINLPANDEVHGIFMFRKQETDGTITRQWLVVQGTNVLRWDGVAWQNEGTLAGDQMATAAQLGNRMVLTNGSGDPKIWDGTDLQDLNYQPLDMTFLSVTNSGVLLAGDYKFAYAAFSPDTSDLTKLCTIEEKTVVANDYATYTIPANPNLPARFTKYRLFRSQLGQVDMQFERDVDITDRTLTQNERWGETITDTNLQEIYGNDNDPMPKFEVVYQWNDRLWGLGNPEEPSSLQYTKLNAPGHWPILNGIDMDPKDGFPLRGMRELGPRRLFVFKENRIYLVSSDPLLTYSHSPIPTRQGLVNHYAVAERDGFLFGISQNDLWVFDGNIPRSMARNRYASIIEDQVDNPSNQEPSFIVSDLVERRGELLVSVRGLVKTKSLLLRPENGALSERTGLLVGQKLFQGERADGSHIILGCFYGNTDKIYQHLEDANGDPALDYDGTGYVAKWRSASVDPDPDSPVKLGLYIDHLIGGTDADDGNGPWTARIYLDDNPTHELEISQAAFGAGGEEAKRYRKRLTSTHWERIQIEFETIGTAGLKFLGARVSYKQAGDLIAT